VAARRRAGRATARRRRARAADARPEVAIGHVVLEVADPRRAAAFYRALGLRPVVERDGMAILELRGGTHLLLFRRRGRAKGGPVRAFDFMVDDVDGAHAAAGRARLRRTPIGEDAAIGHRWFEVTDPDGHVLRVFSSHTQGRPV
jgi:catechol 2,3-dioxygenase-like lactoylglutathione lyase family enzyme